MFHRTDFGGFLVCRYKAIQQLNDVEKNSVAISLMLNHSLTGLLMKVSSRCWSPFHAIECVFSRNEQQKV